MGEVYLWGYAFVGYISSGSSHTAWSTTATWKHQAERGDHIPLTHLITSSVCKYLESASCAYTERREGKETRKAWCLCPNLSVATHSVETESGEARREPTYPQRHCFSELLDGETQGRFIEKGKRMGFLATGINRRISKVEGEGWQAEATGPLRSVCSKQN